MKHGLSPDDAILRDPFEQFRLPPSAFDHAAYVRLAYSYLCDLPTDQAAERMKAALPACLDHLGAGRTKFHETLTRAWVMAVRHFMEVSAPCETGQQFLALNPRLLDSQIMLTHYSAESLFSQAARNSFVRPDRAAIPKYAQ